MALTRDLLACLLTNLNSFRPTPGIPILSRAAMQAFARGSLSSAWPKVVGHGHTIERLADWEAEVFDFFDFILCVFRFCITTSW